MMKCKGFCEIPTAALIGEQFTLTTTSQVLLKQLWTAVYDWALKETLDISWS